MKATSSMKPQCCQTEELFEKLQASKEGWERSELLIQLIDALNVCMDEEGLFYPWRHTTRQERAARSLEAITQRQVARQALQDVLINASLSFEMRLRILRYLMNHHAQHAREEAISGVEQAMSSGHLEIIGSRVTALHGVAAARSSQTTQPPPMADDYEAKSTREGYAQAA